MKQYFAILCDTYSNGLEYRGIVAESKEIAIKEAARYDGDRYVLQDVAELTDDGYLVVTEELKRRFPEVGYRFNFRY